MAGRGHGRGRAAFTFDIQAIGFSKGESLPEVVYKPSPLFPPTNFKAIAPKTGEDEDYMLALKQEFRGTMKRMPYFLSRQDDDQRIERYSAKYSLEQAKELDAQWTPDWRRLPRELKPRKKITKKVVKKKDKPTTPSTNVDILAKIEELEKKGDEEKSDEETEGKEKDKAEDEEDVESEVYDEEEQEEENDYIASYFEDGDDFGGGSDDNMDEATY
ncbi:DNA-directed RNA polymerase III subunit RPC7 isoform X2 [Pleurodeles waltl]|uniref:DNA-directed RNA polymerase III subunit RPC7 isoform X2 n=1 Tax=Pleurodeles waltl TaxID=8319 RepID=UPI00370980C7